METREAILYEALPGKRVRCRVCAHECTVEAGRRGICAVRENVDGRLVTRVYGRVVARDVDPIEKKPLFHFYPGTRAYSIATVGCNFRCLNCQNHFISQYPRDHGGRVIGDRVAPARIVEDALSSGCHSVAYTYSEPTVAIEFVLDVMRCARERGLKNVWVSNGYLTGESAGLVIPLLDAINIDLKAVSDDVYHHVIGGNVRPVLSTIERMSSSGVWVEVTTLVIPGINDSEDQLRWTAEALVGISPAIPWHVSRFFPAYRLVDCPPTPIRTLERARAIGLDVGLRYVYIGNLPGEGETTLCPSCGERVIVRSGYSVQENNVQEGRCPACGASLDGVWFAEP